MTKDGVPGTIKAVEVCFPRALRQRCLAHRIRNLAAKLLDDVWPEKARAQVSHQASSRAIACEVAAGVTGHEFSSKINDELTLFACDSGL